MVEKYYFYRNCHMSNNLKIILCYINIYFYLFILIFQQQKSRMRETSHKRINMSMNHFIKHLFSFDYSRDYFNISKDVVST